MNNHILIKGEKKKNPIKNKRTYTGFREIPKLKNDIVSHTGSWWDKIGFVLLH